MPQPFIPNVNGVPAGDAQTLDPDFRPNSTDNVNFTIQRELSRKATIEFGYLGRRIRHEYQQVNLNAIPYMTTLGGQQFAQAYGAPSAPKNSTASQF